jgi:hypothetical protein
LPYLFNWFVNKASKKYDITLITRLMSNVLLSFQIFKA